VLSVFASDASDRRVIEVKVNGRNWSGVDSLFADAGPEPEGAITLLRELALVVPLGASAAMNRAVVQRTLHGLPRSTDLEQSPAVSWRGWRSHGGALAAPLAENEIHELERAVGRLPSEYRDFVARIGSAGAGAGYGLFAPTQGVLKRFEGAFSWTNGASPTGRPSGVLPLAHAGCGVFWLLVLTGPDRGQVWVDSRASDERVHREAPSFEAWYRDWIDRAIRGLRPRAVWDTRCCGTGSVLSQYLTAIEKEEGPIKAGSKPLAGRVAPGKLSIMGSAGPYLASSSALDPCHHCVALAIGLGLEEEAFALGAPPLVAEPTLDPVRRAGASAGFFSWLRRVKR
jgi:hypothetical protein